MFNAILDKINKFNAIRDKINMFNAILQVPIKLD